jgi:SMC interacting uncharacterized protein involved in chromosome segregation
MQYNQQEKHQNMARPFPFEQKLFAEARVGSVFQVQLKFKKTGQEIATSIKGVIADLNRNIEQKLAKIEKICETRGVTVSEVLEGVQDHEKYLAYETKISSALPQTANILNALQADLNVLRNEASGVVGLQQRITDLERVATHINKVTEFELSYSELVNFGFN